MKCNLTVYITFSPFSLGRAEDDDHLADNEVSNDVYTILAHLDDVFSKAVSHHLSMIVRKFIFIVSPPDSVTCMTDSH